MFNYRVKELRKMALVDNLVLARVERLIDGKSSVRILRRSAVVGELVTDAEFYLAIGDDRVDMQ